MKLCIIITVLIHLFLAQQVTTQKPSRKPRNAPAMPTLKPRGSASPTRKPRGEVKPTRKPRVYEPTKKPRNDPTRKPLDNPTKKPHNTVSPAKPFSPKPRNAPTSPTRKPRKPRVLTGKPRNTPMPTVKPPMSLSLSMFMF